MTVGDLYDALALMPADAPVMIPWSGASTPWLTPAEVRYDEDRVILRMVPV